MNIVDELFSTIGIRRPVLRALSEKSGVSYMSLERWSRRQASPRIDLFVALANSAGFDVALIPREKVMKSKSKFIRLVTRIGRVEAFLDNHMVGYVENDTLYGIDRKGFAIEVCTINHRVEIAAKLIEWRKEQHIAE